MAEYHKENLLGLAIDLLRSEMPSQIETVDVDSTTYDDGSSSLTITVDRPAKEVEELPVHDQQEAIQFIQNKLLRTTSVGLSDGTIKQILDAEEDYMRSKGIIED